MGLKNKQEACFVVDNSYWKARSYVFWINAKFFYMLLKEKKFRGEAFSDGILAI